LLLSLEAQLKCSQDECQRLFLLKERGSAELLSYQQSIAKLQQEVALLLDERESFTRQQQGQVSALQAELAELRGSKGQQQALFIRLLELIVFKTAEIEGLRARLMSSQRASQQINSQMQELHFANY